MLFNEFEKVRLEDWKNKIIADLKGKDFEETLIWKTDEGFDVSPIYNNESLEKNKAIHYDLNTTNDTLEIREIIEITDVNLANKQALSALEGGANSIQFNGEINDMNALSSLLEGIMIDIISVHFRTTSPNVTSKLLLSYCEKNKIEIQSISGSLGYDYIGNAKDSTDLIELCSAKTSLKNVIIEGYKYTDGGSTATQELAFTLNQAVHYIDILTENGIEADKAINNVVFEIGAGSNYFMEIAKIRALRILWQLICDAYKVESSCYIHCKTTAYNISAEDAETNILRTTTEAMSSIIGGCNSLSITPFNSAYKNNADFSKRIARNISILLQEEAYLDKVNDIAKGSYYIERLTDQLVEQSLELFKKIEISGGFMANLDFIKGEVEMANNNRIAEYKSQKRTLLGVNKHPNGMEEKKTYTPFVKDEGIIKPVNLSESIS